METLLCGNMGNISISTGCLWRKCSVKTKQRSESCHAGNGTGNHGDEYYLFYGNGQRCAFESRCHNCVCTPFAFSVEKSSYIHHRSIHRGSTCGAFFKSHVW